MLINKHIIQISALFFCLAPFAGCAEVPPVAHAVQVDVVSKTSFARVARIDTFIKMNWICTRQFRDERCTDGVDYRDAIVEIASYTWLPTIHVLIPSSESIATGDIVLINFPTAQNIAYLNNPQNYRFFLRKTESGDHCQWVTNEKNSGVVCRSWDYRTGYIGDGSFETRAYDK